MAGRYQEALVEARKSIEADPDFAISYFNLGDEAASEFHKVLDHRGVVGSDPIGALAHLQLGRAHALSGGKMKAKAAYETFLTLWKQADPDIPIFRQAKSLYSQLNQG